MSCSGIELIIFYSFMVKKKRGREAGQQLRWAWKLCIFCSKPESISFIQRFFALAIFYRENKGLCKFYQHCSAPCEGFLSGNGGGSEGLCSISYQIYSSCSGILLPDRFWMRHLPKYSLPLYLESHFSHRCAIEELTPLYSEIGDFRSYNCSGCYLCNVVKLHKGRCHTHHFFTHPTH